MESQSCESDIVQDSSVFIGVDPVQSFQDLEILITKTLADHAQCWYIRITIKMRFNFFEGQARYARVVDVFTGLCRMRRVQLGGGYFFEL